MRKTRKTKRKTKHADMRHLPPLDLVQRYTINEAADYLRISRAHLYEHIGAGEIGTIKDGTRRFVPGTEIARVSRPPKLVAGG